ncbi:MAG: hypothetical protein COA79_07595 [Planctomycetota bacterium]|nr:MAG: hypothetical protein COA79_07595 [Planctomycetota bacterium]
MDSFDNFNWDNINNYQDFFNLPDGFNKKDLKRSYNKYIKYFKPEKFPEEFQKIRKAYEEAIAFLRDGPLHNIPSDDSEDAILNDYSELSDEFGYDDIMEAANEKESEFRENISIEREKILALLDTKPIDEIYDSLKKNAHKPTHYYHLAIISDVIGNDEGFVYWILKGIKRFGFDSENLGEILNEFVKKMKGENNWKNLILTFSDQCPASLFYQILSDMLSDFGHTLPMDEYIQFLEDCEASLDFNDDYLSDKCYFYLKVIIEFSLKGDFAWLENKFNYIDQNQDLLSEPAFEYFELISSLFAYREIVSLFSTQIRNNDLSDSISKCIDSFCTRDGIEMDKTFLSTLTVIEESGKDLIKFVPFDVEHSYMELLFHIFFFIASNQSARLPFEEDPEIKETIGEEIANVVHEVDKKTNASFLGSFWGIFNLGYMAMLALIGMLPLLLFSVVNSSGIVLGIELFWALGVWFIIKPKFADVLRDKINISIAIRCYRKIWRPIVLKYLLTNRCPLGILLEGINSISNDEQNTPYLHMFMDSDSLLTMVSITSRFK